MDEIGWIYWMDVMDVMNVMDVMDGWMKQDGSNGQMDEAGWMDGWIRWI